MTWPPLPRKVATIACVGIAREDHRPVTLVGMEQLANLTFNLILAKDVDIGYASDDLKRQVSMVTKISLEIPDQPLPRPYLSPYFSLSNVGSLPSLLTELANRLADAKRGETVAAKWICDNVEAWAKGLNGFAEELFLIAIKRKSNFTFDMMRWITHVIKILLAISNSPACDAHTKEELRRHARGLF
jgi:hypothetical protein